MHPELKGPRPACFTPIQWTVWKAGEKALDADLDEPNGYCTHCTLEYQTIQKAMGNCSHPEVEFIEVIPGEPIGVRNKPDATFGDSEH